MWEYRNIPFYGCVNWIFYLTIGKEDTFVPCISFHSFCTYRSKQTKKYTWRGKFKWNKDFGQTKKDWNKKIFFRHKVCLLLISSILVVVMSNWSLKQTKSNCLVSISHYCESIWLYGRHWEGHVAISMLIRLQI